MAVNEGKRYCVGIDVGSYSVGLAAIELDESGKPIELLSCISHIHDSGVDPDNAKDAITRLASSGAARRARRLIRRRRRRLAQLDEFLGNLGWPVKSFESYSDPYFPWKVRAELASAYIPDDEERWEKLSVAIRHIAHHRGWRNPYSRVSSLHFQKPPSDAYDQIKKEIENQTGQVIPQGATVGQMVAFCNFGSHKLRGAGGLMSARLFQSDLANEIIAIAEVQRLDSKIVIDIIDEVFKAESPKGSASRRVGFDPLQPGKRRALKASIEFQHYRIATLLGNLRICENSELRRLTPDEVRTAFEFLISESQKKEVSWGDVCSVLGVDRENLRGTATLTEDGERAGATPPLDQTTRSILNSKVKPLVQWWKMADQEERQAMIDALSGSEYDDFESDAGMKVQAFLVELSDQDLAKLDNLRLPMGRAAYSEDTLGRITQRMLDTGEDLYEARKAIFNLPSDWKPPAPPIGTPVGNPAVDRVLKIVARWLNRVTHEWGTPERITIEHVRDGFSSETQTRELNKRQEKRTQKNRENLAQLHKEFGIEEPRMSDLLRFLAVQRQNGQCAYCGLMIQFRGKSENSFEMDHIVPRKGPGSTNRKENLVAVCSACNRAKSNIPFATWASQQENPNISVEAAVERTRHWVNKEGLTTSEFKKFCQEVRLRLSRKTSDDEIDARSLESVAWMANELRARLVQYFADNGTKVRVFRGATTAQARDAAGITKKISFIDGHGKSRFDRRHHAVDAAVIALMTPTVAQILAERRSQRDAAMLTRSNLEWKTFCGSSEGERFIWNQWRVNMGALAELLNEAIATDHIPVTSNVRLRLGNGKAHPDKPVPLDYKVVGDLLDIDTIKRASTEALWCALTRDPQFDPKLGLPENPDRVIRVHGTQLHASDRIGFFKSDLGCLFVRGGAVALGKFVHHIRIYRYRTQEGVLNYEPMRVFTVDLLRYRNQDLFSVEFPPQTQSRRLCTQSLCESLDEGLAQYVGWLVVGDELEIDTAPFATEESSLGKAEAEIGVIKRWRVAGVEGDGRLRLRPLQLSAEGLTYINSEGKKVDRFGKAVRDLVKGTGWRITVGKLFEKGNVKVIRRDVLGNLRFSSTAHLPVCWVADPQ